MARAFIDAASAYSLLIFSHEDRTWDPESLVTASNMKRSLSLFKDFVCGRVHADMPAGPTMRAVYAVAGQRITEAHVNEARKQ